MRLVRMSRDFVLEWLPTVGGDSTNLNPQDPLRVSEGARKSRRLWDSHDRRKMREPELSWKLRRKREPRRCWNKPLGFGREEREGVAGTNL